MICRYLACYLWAGITGTPNCAGFMTHFRYCNFLYLSYVLFVTFLLVPKRLTAQPHILPAGSPLASLRQASVKQIVADTLTLSNTRIKVGINKNAGGAITYLAFLNDHNGKVNTRNMVSNPDLGRQIQIGLYGGPVNYSDAAGWTNLGWDPIQAGDSYGNPSQIVSIVKQDNLLYAKTIPNQWGIRNQPGEATIEHWISLGNKDSKDSNVVNVHVKVTMNRLSDKTQYAARQQEFPCVYLTGDYHKMWYSKDSPPFTNGSLSLEQIQPPNTILFGDVFPTEPWIASTNENGYGVGLYIQGNNYEWKRGYFGSDLSGDENSTVASYIAATPHVLLDYNLVQEWDYKLVLGQLNDIRSYVYTQPRSLAGPNFQFDTSRKGWFYESSTDTGLPIQGKLHVLLDDAVNARISSPFVFWKGSDNPKIYLRAAFSTQSDKFRMKWRRSADVTTYGTPDRYIEFPINNDGQFHTYTIDLSSDSDWLSQNIGQIMFESVATAAMPNAWAEFAWIATTTTGPSDDTIAIVTPPVPADVVCEPGCTQISVKRVQYVRSNRKR